MIRLIVNYSLMVLIIVVVQVLILSEVSLFNGWAQVYLYSYLIIALPVNFPKKYLMPLGFALGLLMDLFYHTPGIHASACVTLAFFRPYVLAIVQPREGFESLFPEARSMGWINYLTYAGLLLIVHQTWLFLLLYFSTGLMVYALGHALASSLFTLIFVALIQVFNQKRPIY